MSRPLLQYAVRTPSKEQASGYYAAVVFTSRTDLAMTGVVEHYDGRASMVADRKYDKHGLALAVIRKQRLPARDVGGVADPVSPQCAALGTAVARQECTTAVPIWHRTADPYRVWAIPGRIKLTDKGVQRVRLRRVHPRAPDVCCSFRPLLANSHIEVVLG